MVHFGQALRTVAAATLLGQAVAHPGHDLAGEIAERNAFYQHSKRDLTHCNGVFDKRGIEDKQRRRRQDAISEARSKRGLPQSLYSRSGESQSGSTDHFQGVMLLNATLLTSLAWMSVPPPLGWKTSSSATHPAFYHQRVH
jgi:hypothetical protein